MEQITVVQYLIQELNRLGVTDFFGLPGDYNFNILDAIIDNPETNWIGCTNELNAAYAADGYARIKGYGAVVTTFGVGELSAVNAIAGSFAENIPVIKIVGVPDTKYITAKTMVHHNFQDPDYFAFESVYSNVVEDTAYLDMNSPKEEIDRILSVFITKQRPVYIAIPADVCEQKIFNNPDIEAVPSDLCALNKAVEHITKLLNSSNNPVILCDGLVRRFKATKAFNDFLNISGFPVSTLLMGKDIVDSCYSKFLGTFLGKYGSVNAYTALKNSDCPISVGCIFSDINTFKFSIPFNPNDFINIQGDYAIVQNKRYDNVKMNDVLEMLSQIVLFKDINVPDFHWGYDAPESTIEMPLTNNYIYPKLQEFLLPDDSVLAETGIITYSMAQMRLPDNVLLNNQILWGSIGWATPAAFGASMADKSRRTILITGEGSHQLTATEISSMMRHNLKPIIFVINNEGYTIERLLSKNPYDSYNDIAEWNYSKLPDVFAGKAWTAQARTNKELDNVLEQILKENEHNLCYIELFTEKMDLQTFTENIYKGVKRIP